MIFSVVQDSALTASELNHDLELINMWAYQWKMAINPEPKQAVEVLFSQKIDSTIKLNPLMERIEKIQYQAALAITGGWQGSSRIKLYEELGWESLSDRRWYRRLIHFFKIRNNMTPAYLRGNIPRQRSLLFGNCNPNIYHEIFCSTARYMNSFFPDAIKIWNNIDIEFHTCTSLSIFKRNILNPIRLESKTVFGIHDPIGLKRLFQLRIQLSP